MTCPAPNTSRGQNSTGTSPTSPESHVDVFNGDFFSPPTHEDSKSAEENKRVDKKVLTSMTKFFGRFGDEDGRDL